MKLGATKDRKQEVQQVNLFSTPHQPQRKDPASLMFPHSPSRNIIRARGHLCLWEAVTVSLNKPCFLLLPCIAPLSHCSETASANKPLALQLCLRFGFLRNLNRDSTLPLSTTFNIPNSLPNFLSNPDFSTELQTRWTSLLGQSHRHRKLLSAMKLPVLPKHTRVSFPCFGTCPEGALSLQSGRRWLN